MSVFCECFVLSGSSLRSSGWSLVQSSPTDCGASECDRQASKTRRFWPTMASWASKKSVFIKYNIFYHLHGYYFLKEPNPDTAGYQSRALHYLAKLFWFMNHLNEDTAYVKVKWSHHRPGVAQRVGRSIALVFHDRGTRRGWVVSNTPRPHFTPGKDPVTILQESGWAPGPVWMGGKSRPHRDSIPDGPARSQSLYRLSYLAHTQLMCPLLIVFTQYRLLLVTVARMEQSIYRYRTYRSRSLEASQKHDDMTLCGPISKSDWHGWRSRQLWVPRAGFLHFSPETNHTVINQFTHSSDRNFSTDITRASS